MARKKALGQGFDALLGEELQLNELDPDKSRSEIIWIQVNKVHPDSNQPRDNFEQGALEELAESIRSQGIIQPLIVEKLRADEFTIVAGERRWRAASIAGLEKIPVLVRKFSELDKLEIALIENIQREDLSPIEEARAYQRFMDSFGLSHQEIADKVGKNRTTVTNCLRLLKLPESIQDAINSKAISSGHARAILSVNDPVDQTIVFTEIIKDSLSVREAEAFATSITQKKQTPPQSGEKESIKRLDPDLLHIEQQIIESLGTKISLQGEISKGKMTISWYTREDLDQIYTLLVDQGNKLNE